MSTYRRIEREVLRRKVGNKALSKCYSHRLWVNHSFNSSHSDKPKKKKSKLRRAISKLIRGLKNAWKRKRNI